MEGVSSSIFFHSPLQRLYALEQFLNQLFHNIMLFIYELWEQSPHSPVFVFVFVFVKRLFNDNLTSTHDIDTLLGLLHAATGEVVNCQL